MKRAIVSHRHFPEQSDSYRLISHSNPRQYEGISASVANSGDADVAMEGNTTQPSTFNTNINMNANANANTTFSKLPQKQQQQQQQQLNRRRKLRKSRPLHPVGGGIGGGRKGGRRQRRLWQLPESKIREYIEWIREKPEADRTPNEERFLWKSMIRGLCHGNGSNSHYNASNNYNNTGGKRNKQDAIREIVQKTEAKDRHERTEHDELFLLMFYRRKAQRKSKKQQQPFRDAETKTETTLSWMRQSSSSKSRQNHRESNTINNNNSSNQSGLEPMASLESLRESMNKMGLSSNKLKQVRFADPPKHENFERR
mmetsp:Transcript_9142/g.27192  ORF Transcript_9142/g.27192 Transcript_9142/m.27192 type:complete len:313 (-) Transcript_9142:931-1869(-)